MIRIEDHLKYNPQWQSEDSLKTFLRNKIREGALYFRNDDSRAEMVDLVTVYSYPERQSFIYPVRYIRTSLLVPSQKHVSTSTMFHLLEKDKWEFPVFVVVVDGKYYLRDGHHRVWICDALGHKNILAHTIYADTEEINYG